MRSHLSVLWATDFFSTDVWTLGGLVTFYVLFLIKLDTREVHLAGVTCHPNEMWMMQMARNLHFLGPKAANDLEGPIQCHERLGGLLKSRVRGCS
jgi:hypothetical protein